MINTNDAIRCMNDEDLIYYTREIVRRGCEIEADLLLHLAKIDERGLYRNRAFPSMFAFCVMERREPCGRAGAGSGQVESRDRGAGGAPRPEAARTDGDPEASRSW